ncbi:sugar phosphate isomerase/epimerase family protein [Halocatena halophila]|uniref:sugar phosphate isomerase/epimerase family protein n=1 Tax=Halocatena halophila TaxID=2814576 RepID=UPI002ED5EABA
MVELAFSTNAYTEYELSEAIDRIAAIGYDGVEILGDVPHAFFPEFDESSWVTLAEHLEEAALAVSNVNANTARGYYDDAPPSSFFDPTIITANTTDRRWRIEYTKSAIDFATVVDAPAVCLTSGRPLAGTPPERAREYLLDSLAEITRYAEARDVHLGIEFEPELLIECTDEALELIDEVDSDALGINLDIGHVAVYGEDVPAAIRRCGGHLTGLHIEDIVGGRGGKHYHRIPGEGDLDFGRLFDALDDIDYTGHATLELYTYPDTPDRAARESLRVLSSFV